MCSSQSILQRVAYVSCRGYKLQRYEYPAERMAESHESRWHREIVLFVLDRSIFFCRGVFLLILPLITCERVFLRKGRKVEEGWNFYRHWKK